jgi:hypothetical protein
MCPSGAVMIDQAGRVLAAAGNEREIRHDPTCARGDLGVDGRPPDGCDPGG